MAILKVVNSKGKYFDKRAKEDVVNYVLNQSKMPHSYFDGMCVDMQNIAESMHQISAHFNKEKGVQLRHFVIAFAHWELNDPAIANEIAYSILYFLGAEYQTIFAVHEDPDQLHIHIVMNSVSHIDGHRYRGTRAEFYLFRNYVASVLSKYGIRLHYVSNQ